LHVSLNKITDKNLKKKKRTKFVASWLAVATSQRARARSVAVRQFLTEKRKPSLERSPYSPDIASFESILFAAVA
jgi:hypothetical protein